MDYNELYRRKSEVLADGMPRHLGSIEGLLTAMARHDTDMDKIYSSGLGAAITQMMENTIINRDEHSPASVAYWAKLGMVKEFHGEDVPMDWEEYEQKTGFHFRWEPGVPEQNRVKKWTSFVPVSAFRPENKDRKYPLMFVLHGAGNDIYTIDGWGYVNVAAEKEWIVIVPSLEMQEIILEILDEAKKLWNVDESRVYITGFSYGSHNTNIVAHQHPEIFAAAGPCGGFLTDGTMTGFISSVYRGPEINQPKEPRVPEVPEVPEVPKVPEERKLFEPFVEFTGNAYKALEQSIKMPCITVSGNRDGYKYPVYDVPGKEKMVDDLNLWARINDAPEVKLEDVIALAEREASPAEKQIGIPVEEGCGWCKTADGVEYSVADMKSRDGIIRVRVVCGDNVPHWPTPELSKFVVDFFEHFSRDPITGESIYNP